MKWLKWQKPVLSELKSDWKYAAINNYLELQKVLM